MEIFHNKVKNQYIFATNRSGTSFLNSDIVKKLGWKKKYPISNKLKIDNTTTVVKVVRDPYDRWKSWFDMFVLDITDIDYWTLSQSHQWLDEFKKTFFLDVHTEKQSILLNSIKTNSNEIIYVRMEDLNIFLKISNQRHTTSYYNRFESLPANVRHFFYYQIKKIYRDDHRWIKSLPIHTF